MPGIYIQGLADPPGTNTGFTLKHLAKCDF